MSIPIISPTLDTAYVDSAKWLITELSRDGFPNGYAAELTTQYLEDVISAHGVSREFRYALESREVEAQLERSDRFWRKHSRVEARS